MYLYTDLERREPPPAEWWDGPLALLAVIVLPVTLALIIARACLRKLRRNSAPPEEHEDYSYWPFSSLEEYEQALRQPKLLSSQSMTTGDDDTTIIYVDQHVDEHVVTATPEPAPFKLDLYRATEEALEAAGLAGRRATRSVDRESRIRVAELLRHLAAGQITCGEYQRMRPTTSDIGVHAAYQVVGQIYGDGAYTVADLPLDGGFAGTSRLDTDRRSTLARTILFLQTDRVYAWAPLRLRWWQAVLLVPSTCTGLLLAASVLCAIMCETSPFTGIMLLVAVSVGSVSLTDALYGKLIGRDERLWPFHRRRDYREALKHPKLLCGMKGKA